MALRPDATLRPVLVVSLLVLSLASCASPEGYLSGASGVSAYDQACGSLLDSLCVAYTRCGFTSSASSCAARLTQIGGVCDAEARASLSDARMGFSASRFARCQEALGSATCESLFTPGAVPGCNDFLRSQLERGEGCFRSAECPATDHCDTSATCPGVCAARKGVGEQTDSVEGCAEGLDALDGTCRAPVAAGQSCAPLSEGGAQQRCVDGSLCSPENVCSPLARAGMACGTDTQCAVGLVCSGTTHTCEAAHSQGEPCSLSAMNCKLDLTCAVQDAQALTGTCQPLRGVGGTCASSDDCTRGLQCSGSSFGAGGFVAGACAPPKALGASCTAWTECTGDAYCENGQCVARKAAGAACTAFSECGEFLDCESGTCQLAGCRDITP